MGWIDPTSLLECMTVTKTVLLVMAPSTASAVTNPSPSTGTLVTVIAPSASAAAKYFSTAGCSMLVVLV
jgi:hypothetical protein